MKHNDDNLLANFSNGSLGVRSNHLLRLGEAYCRAKETLQAIE